MKTPRVPASLRRIVLLCATILCPAFSFAQRTTITDELGGVAGTPLNGVAVQSVEIARGAPGPSPRWVASPTIIYAADRPGVTTSRDAGGDFKVRVPNDDSGLLILKADVRVQSADWVGLTFLASPDASVFDRKNPLLVILTASGYVQVLKNGASELLYSSAPALSGWDARRVYSLEVRYDRTANTVDVLVDGSRINGRPLVPGPLNDASFGAVGVRFHGASIKATEPGAAYFSYAVR